MLQVRKAEERGKANFGWLDSRHSFSFGEYYDPAHMSFRALRVLNDDRIDAGSGFPKHPHRDMEIISVVLEGALEHKDSMGNGTVMRPGDVQRMSAGTGVAHSEWNPSRTEPAHFLQIWIVPEQRNLPPSYAQQNFPKTERRQRLRLVASRDGRDGSLVVHQDVDLYATVLDNGERVTHSVADGRSVWIQVASGSVRVGDTLLHEGDGAAISGEHEVSLEGVESGETLLFDLA